MTTPPAGQTDGTRDGAARPAHQVAERLGVRPGTLVQSIGEDDDTDPDLLAACAEVAGEPLVPEDADDVVDIVLLWWREDDGDLVDALVDARRNLAEAGVVWLLTPKTGRPGHVDASDVQEAVPTAGLAQTSTVSAAAAWSGIRLVAPKTARSARR